MRYILTIAILMFQFTTLYGQSVNYYAGNTIVNADSFIFNVKETNDWLTYYEVENAQNSLFYQVWKQKGGNYPDYRMTTQAFLRDKNSFYKLFKEVVSQNDINIAKSYVRNEKERGSFSVYMVVLASGKVAEVRFVFGRDYAHIKPAVLKNLEIKIKEEMEFFIPDRVSEMMDYIKGVKVYVNVDNL